MPGFQFSICNTSNNFEFADGLPQLPNVPRPGLGDHDARPGVYTFMVTQSEKKDVASHFKNGTHGVLVRFVKLLLLELFLKMNL